MQTRLSTEERQVEIVEAALRLACESSPALITTADIATAIGVTQGAVFKHFPTKDAIWLAAMRWVRETLLHKVRAAAEEAATPVDALAGMFRGNNGEQDAAVKVAVQIEMNSGQLGLWWHDGVVHDQRTGVSAHSLPPGTVRLRSVSSMRKMNCPPVFLASR